MAAFVEAPAFYSLGTSATPSPISLTVPAGAEYVAVLGVCSGDNVTAGGLASISGNFTGTWTSSDRNSTPTAVATFAAYAPVTSTGASKTITVVWDNAHTLAGTGVYVCFVQGVDPTTPVLGIDTTGATGTGATAGTATVNSETTGLVFAVDMRLDTIAADVYPGNESGYTSLLTSKSTAAYAVYARLRQANSPGSSTTSATTQTTNASALSLISFKSAPVGPGITFVGSATGTTTATMPTHQVGDFIFVFSYRDGNTTAPPNVSDYSSLTTASGSTNSARVSVKVALTTSETVGTWTNATSTIVAVYRGLDFDNPIGGINSTSGSSTTISFPALTMAVTDGTSWVAGMAGHRSTNVAIETAPSGMTNRVSVSDATDEAAWHDSNGGRTSWSATNASVGGTSSGYASITVELRADTPATLTGQAVDLVSTTSGTPKVTTNKFMGTLYMVCVADGDTPSVTQIKAGQNSAGISAIAAESISVTDIGLQVFTTVTGLTTGTPYDFWFVHTTPVGDSTAYKADFTPSSGTPPSNSALFWAYP